MPRIHGRLNEEHFRQLVSGKVATLSTKDLTHHDTEVLLILEDIGWERMMHIIAAEMGKRDRG
jgi:hypothetical protein